MARQSSLIRGIGSKALERLILADAPMGYWPCDETSGSTLYDRSGNGYDLTLVGSPELAAFPLINGDETKFLRLPSGTVSGAERPGLLGVTAPLAGAFSFECIAMQFLSTGSENFIFAFAGSGETADVNLQFSFQLTSSEGARVFWESGSGTDRAYTTGASNLVNGCIPMHWMFTMSAVGWMTFYMNGRRVHPDLSITGVTRPTGGTGAVGTCIGRSTSYLNAALSRTLAIGHVAFYGGVELDRFAARERAIVSGFWGEVG